MEIGKAMQTDLRLTLLALCGLISFPLGASAAAQTEQGLTNSVGMEFIRIPAGTFMMGSPEASKEALDEEKPQHKVTISTPFYVGKYEVTQAQWKAVMGTDSNALPKSNSFFQIPGMEKRISNPNNPANMSWNDAQEFVKKLNQKEDGDKYRLPTEAEWEYAARAGTTTAYSFGGDKNDLGTYAWFGEGFGSGSSHPVGTKKPNPWGNAVQLS